MCLPKERQSTDRPGLLLSVDSHYTYVRVSNYIRIHSNFMLCSKKKHTVKTDPKSNTKIVERGKIDTSYTNIHDLSLSWFGTGTSINIVAGLDYCYGPKPPLHNTPIYTATNLSNSYSNDMLTVKLSGFPDMHWRDLFTSTRRQVAHYYLVFKHFLQKRPCNSTQFKNS